MALCLCVVIGLRSDSTAQNRTTTREASLSQVFEIQHSRPSQIAEILRDALGAEVHIVAADDAHKIIAVAEQKESLQLFEALLKELDVPRAKDSRLTHIHRAQFRPVRSLEDLVKIYFQDYFIDDVHNSVIGRGSIDVVEEFNFAMAEADKAATSLRLDCWLLHPANGRLIADQPELKEITKELELMSLSGYRVFGRAALATLDTEAFELDQQFDAQKLADSSGIRRPGEPRLVAFDALSLQGKIGLNRESEYTVELRTQLTLDGAHITFRNTVRTRDGMPVIVGFAPAGGQQVDPIVIVLRVAKQH